MYYAMPTLTVYSYPSYIKNMSKIPADSVNFKEKKD